MADSSVKDSLLQILTENGISFEGDLEDQIINIDSFAFITLIIDIENEFGIKISPEEIIQFSEDENKSIQYLIDFINKKLSN